MTIITGLGLLLLTLAAFSLFSMKAPKGSAAMSGMANAAVATFLVEAVHRYISGDLLHLAFLGETGTISGNMGGVAAAIMVPIGMGVNPVFAVVAGVAWEDTASFRDLSRDMQLVSSHRLLRSIFRRAWIPCWGLS